MDDLLIAPTRYTPRIAFEQSKHTFLVQGVSRPENTVDFYQPVLNWVDDYIGMQARTMPLERKPVTLILDMDYFNSVSAKYLIALLLKCKRLQREGGGLRVQWRYYAQEEEGREWVEGISGIAGVHFEMVEKPGESKLWNDSLESF